MLKNFKLIKRSTKLAPTISKMPNANGGTSWVISIRGIIDTTDKYAAACDILNNALETDTVLIVLNTPGGIVNTGLALLNAMKHCKAVVTTRAVGMVASCGAIIWVNGHKLEACDFSRIMFHSSSGGFMGKTKDQKDYATCMESIMKELTKVAVDRKVLSPEQFTDIFEAKQDVYLNITDLKNSGVEFNHA